MKNDVIPPELAERIENAMEIAWKSPGGMALDANKCQDCEGHWHIMICPVVREVMGGKHDGSQQYARFIVNINKFIRMFDKRPKIFFDTAQGESVPHIIAVGIIGGYKCDVSLMCCPPTNMLPIERVYAAGPKKGTIEILNDEDESPESPGFIGTDE